MKAALALCILVVGCKSDESKGSDIADKASSWAATAGVVTAAMTENRVPSTYGRKTLEDARKDLDAWQQKVGTLQLSDTMRNKVSHALTEESDSLRRLRAELARRGE
jgi:hypothetical protein